MIDRDELRAKLGDGGELVIVDALPPMSYAHSHLPGAINLPPERVDPLLGRGDLVNGNGLHHPALSPACGFDGAEAPFVGGAPSGGT